MNSGKLFCAPPDNQLFNARQVRADPKRFFLLSLHENFRKQNVFRRKKRKKRIWALIKRTYFMRFLFLKKPESRYFLPIPFLLLPHKKKRLSLKQKQNKSQEKNLVFLKLL